MGAAGYTEAIFAVCAAVYGALLVLLFLSGRANATRIFLIAACAASGVWAAAIATGLAGIPGPPGAIAERVCLGPWCGFILHLLYREGHRSDRLHLAPIGGVLLGMVIFGLAFLEPTLPRVGSIPLTVAAELYARIGLAIYGLLLT